MTLSSCGIDNMTSSSRQPLLAAADDGDDDDGKWQKRARTEDDEEERDIVQAAGVSTGRAFLALLVAACVAAFCVMLVSRKRGLGHSKQLSEMARWAYRRPTDISARGTAASNPFVATDLRHAMRHARRGRGAASPGSRSGRGGRGGRGLVVAAGTGAGHGDPFGIGLFGNAPFGARPFGTLPFGSPLARGGGGFGGSGGGGGRGGPCYSLSTPMCDADLPPNHTCVLPAADHLRARDAHAICGRRLPRSNPCWEEADGNVSCLPAFYLLGEMKCGTTTLYKLLGEHPSIALPAQKEPRYLTLPKYRHRTGSWYASNFATVLHKGHEALTFDASPTVFNSPLLAPGWLRKWLPFTRMVVLLRDPVQRTYSHWRMGVAWLRDSPCFAAERPTSKLFEEASRRLPGRNASSAERASAVAAALKSAAVAAAAAAAATRRVPIAEIRMMKEVFSFDAVARLGVMEVVLRECGASSGWGKEGGFIALSNATKACVLRSHVGETVAGLWNARQGLAAKRTAAESEAYVEGMRRVSVCSEYMLRAGAGVWRSSRYAANLEAWLSHFPRAQIKVVATEEMERDPRGTVGSVLKFVGLRTEPARSGGSGGGGGGDGGATGRGRRLREVVRVRGRPGAPTAEALAARRRQRALPLPARGKEEPAASASASAAAPGAGEARSNGAGADGGSTGRWCVLGKRGVMDEAPDSRADTSSEEDGDGSGGIGACTSDGEKQLSSADGVRRYTTIDKATAELLHEFFDPYNQRLFALIGRTLPWEGVGEAASVSQYLAKPQ